jgi:chemotaxis protein MotB
MARKKHEEGKENTERYLLTYSDMITLLMLFFIVLYSMSSVEVGKSKQLAEELQSVFAGGNWGIFETMGRTQRRGIDSFSGSGGIGSKNPYQTKNTQQIKTFTEAKELFKPEIQAKYLQVTMDERGLVITLTGDIFFEGGSAHMENQARPVLNKVSSILKALPNFVRIEGHTDNSKMSVSKSGENYQTNWDLSSARSISILRYLAEENSIDPRRLSSVAFGEYRPIDDNNIPEGRAYNRRVDIVILNEKPISGQTNPDIPRPLPDEEWR